MKYILLWCMASLCGVNLVFGQQVAVIRSGNFGGLHEISLVDSVWFFHAGDLPHAGSGLTNTDGLDTTRNTTFGKNNHPHGWRGLGWFGCWVKVDPGLVGKKLGLRINHDGASEIFIDGKPIGGYGKVRHSAEEMEAIRAPKDIIPLWFSDTRPHLISIYYSNFFGVYSDFWGFQVTIGDYGGLSQRMGRNIQLFSYVPMCAAAQLILALLHFFLFLFNRQQKHYLYYALFVLLIAVNAISVYLFYQTRHPSVQYLAEFMTYECKVLILWSCVVLLYVLDYGRIPRWRITILTGVSLIYLLGYILEYFVFYAQDWTDYFSITFSVCIADGFLSAFHIMKKRQKGVWLVGAGVIAIILLYYFGWADVFHLWSYRQNAMRVFVMNAGELVLPLCLSIYLGLDFARTNQSLVAKLTEVESLSEQALAQEAEKRELIAGEAKRLEAEVQQRTATLKEQADKLREMDTFKSHFFTNITHEFRTPLTLILNPAKELLSNSSDFDARQYAQLIINNATRLSQLINQLLDLSKLESGLMQVNAQPIDLFALIKMHVSSYGSIAKSKGISLHFIAEPDQLWIYGDRDKLEKIFLNILSNAVKFTDAGKVDIFLREDHDAITGNTFNITVRDTGRGIAAEKLPYIFTRFYQADPSNTRSAEGTGIGLALTRELVNLMGGEIRAESVDGLFTEINVRMPYEPAEAVLETMADDTAGAVVDMIPATSADETKPLILVIEDHSELRDFTHKLLSQSYRVITAADGNTGVALGLEHIPNLIITDLMMPVMDGYQVSAKLKADEKTSHIPIIILTAKGDLDSRIQGIETGSDAYLTKPFDKRELFALIENLIAVRSQLRDYYSRNSMWLNGDPSIPMIEQSFIARVRAAVENHLNEEGYSADQLAVDMGMSRTQLHRKLKGLIGQAPGELIRIIRLQYAHDLLQRQVATVSEVAYMVGFSSPASFSSSFSRHFGFPPKMVVVS